MMNINILCFCILLFMSMDCYNNLVISSYNCWGVMSSIGYIDSLLKQTDVLCIQEHHLYPDNKCFLEKYDPTYKAFVRCDSSLSVDDVTRIRKGGVAIMWKADLDYCVTKMENIGTDRIIMIKISRMECQPLYIMNVYMPSTNTDIEGYKDVLSEVKLIYEYFCIRGLVIIAGDINGQLGPQAGPRCPMSPSHRGRLFWEFLNECQITPLICQQKCTGPLVTFYPHGGGPGTQIDHICLEKRYMEHIVSCNVFLDESRNMSDHVPIRVVVKYNIPRYTQKTRSVFRWDRANPETYQQCLNFLISNNEILNNGIKTEDDIPIYANEIQTCMTEAAERIVPKSKYQHYKKPFWDSELKAVQKDQWEKRKIWLLEGQPRGMSYESYRKYKSAKRKYINLYGLKRELYEQSKLEEISCMCDSDTTKFWKYVRTHKDPMITLHAIKDGDMVYSSPEELLGMWKNHYETLLNEQEDEAKLYDKSFKQNIDFQVEQLSKNMSKDIDTMGIFQNEFTEQEIQNLSKSLPNGKSPGYDLISYENIKNGGLILYKHISELFNGIIKFVYIPDFYKYGLLINAHKGKRKPRDNKDSYRGITLMPCMNKLLEKCVWSRLWPWLKSIGFPNPLQHACCPGCSSIMLSFVVQESINYHCEKGGKVFACFLDSEKAFDKVWWNGLLVKLHNIGIRDKMWFLIKEWLHGSMCSVLVNGMVSEPFKITRSIKQGGLLSMFLYVAFINDFHPYVNANGSGLKVYDLDVGSPTQADDILMLTNTKYGLDDMMSLAAEYGVLWRIAFSIIKTQCAVFEKSKSHGMTYEWLMNGRNIEEVDEIMHVGIKLSNTFKSKNRTHEMCSRGRSQMGALSAVGVHGHGLNPLTSSHIWEKVTLPSILYGSELWNNLTHSEILELERTQKFAAKRIQGFHRRTHDEITRGFLHWHTMESIIDCKKLLFLQKLISLDGDYLAKQILLYRIYDYMLGNETKGFVPEIVDILWKYELIEYLYIYIKGGQFMDKIPWKYTVKSCVDQYVRGQQENSLRDKGDTVYAIQVLNSPHMNLYNIAKLYPKHRFQIQSIVRLCTYPILIEGVCCCLCTETVHDRVKHLICDCPVLTQPRQTMWDNVTDVMGTRLSSELYNMDETDLICILLGKYWASVEVEQENEKLYEQFIIAISQFLKVVDTTMQKMTSYN